MLSSSWILVFTLSIVSNACMRKCSVLSFWMWSDSVLPSSSCDPAKIKRCWSGGMAFIVLDLGFHVVDRVEHLLGVLNQCGWGDNPIAANHRPESWMTHPLDSKC